MVISAQLRAARAYLGWTMDEAAAAASIHRRTVIRLESDADYARREPASLKRLVAVYQAQKIMLVDNGLAIAMEDFLAVAGLRSSTMPHDGGR